MKGEYSEKGNYLYNLAIWVSGRVCSYVLLSIHSSWSSSWLQTLSIHSSTLALLTQGNAIPFNRLWMIPTFFFFFDHVKCSHQVWPFDGSRRELMKNITTPVGGGRWRKLLRWMDENELWELWSIGRSHKHSRTLRFKFHGTMKMTTTTIRCLLRGRRLRRRRSVPFSFLPKTNKPTSKPNRLNTTSQVKPLQIFSSNLSSSSLFLSLFPCITSWSDRQADNCYSQCPCTYGFKLQLSSPACQWIHCYILHSSIPETRSNRIQPCPARWCCCWLQWKWTLISRECPWKIKEKFHLRKFSLNNILEILCAFLMAVYG